MDRLTLLAQAQEAGLEVKVDGDRLVIRRPKRAEPLAKELLAHKQAVLEALSVHPTTAPLSHQERGASLPDYAATACVCPVPIGPTGNTRCPACQLPLICPGCGRCRGCKLRLKFPPEREPYG
jgi:hypothetical protein